MLLDRLKRELLRNPKKTGVLAVMLLVAIYFWAPLVSEWVGWSGEETPAANQVASSPRRTPKVAAPSTSQALTATRKRPADSWQDVVASIESDSFTQAAELAASAQDPFAELPIVENQQVAVESQLAEMPLPGTVESASEIPEQLTPQAAGLVLMSTIVSEHLRVATISGRSYREGKRIALKAGAVDASPIAFRLDKVTSSHVVLSRDGTRYQLEIERPNLAGQDRIEFGKLSMSE